MRLFEVADRFVDDLETLLRNLVGRGDSKHSPQSLTYPALSNLLKNMGYGEISYDQFSRIYDENPEIQPLIRNYNDQGIILGTKEEGDQDKEKMDIGLGAKTVDQMAHNAISKEF
jgi:hypothetical protein